MRAKLLIAALAAGLLTLTACSGVPTSSVPQIVRTASGSSVTSPTSQASPANGLGSRDIILGFLRASVSNDEQHQAARLFLTAAAAGKWNDSTATIIDDYTVGIAVTTGHTASVKVSGRIVGSLDQFGVYTPKITGEGASARQQWAFGTTLVNGQWRITTPPVGLLISRADFESAYHPRPLYFFNQAESRLVPDLRYSAADGQSLASWMLSRLIDGPQPDMQNGLVSEIPDQVDATRAKITVGSPMVISLPGISAVEASTIPKVAAELAYTLGSLQGGGNIEISDGTKAITPLGLPQQFNKSNFSTADPVPAALAAPSVYYLRNGGVIGPNNLPISGSAGTSRYALTTVAVSTISPGDVRLAGVAADVNPQRLLVGTQTGGLASIALPRAATSRPEWYRDLAEPWIGAGSYLVRVADGKAVTVPYTADSATLAGLVVRSIRFSQDGTRVAMVLASADKKAASVWIGIVVRSAAAGSTSSNAVQVENLHQITPADWKVKDVGWSDTLSLRVLFTDTTNDDFHIWALQVDGSAPLTPTSDGLPGEPQWLAVEGNDTDVWVSVNDTLWTENVTGGWTSESSAAGSAPTYAD